MRKILVFGAGGIAPIQYEEGTILFETSKSSEHFAQYDIVVYFSGAFEHRYRRNLLGQNLEPIPPTAIRRENEMRSAIEKGRVICILGSDLNDYATLGILGSSKIGFARLQGGQIFRNINVRRSEFKCFLDDVGATSVYFEKEAVDDIICYVSEDVVAGFSKRIGKGLLIFLPCVWGSNDIKYLVENLKNLVSALISYSARANYEPPIYVNQFLFEKENELRKKIDYITKNEIVPLHTIVMYYESLKSILWLRDENLVKATEKFLKAVGFQTEIDEKHEEDMWITKNKERLVILEVKGLNNNLTRQDIAKLDEHREAREVPKLTGLLIANTFLTADSLTRKDVPFSPNVIEKAINANLLITRTIDLCRIVNHLEGAEPQPSEALLKIMLGQRGWLTFQEGTVKIAS